VLIVMLAWMVGSCGQAPLAYNGVLLPSPQPRGDIPLPPPAWLIDDTDAILGTLAAGGSSRGHGDPAPIIPKIGHARIRSAQPLVIIVKAESLVQAEATLRPWRMDNTITPLIDSTAHNLTVRMHQEGLFTVLTIDPIHVIGDQLLNIHLTFAAADTWGFYLWQLTPTVQTGLLKARQGLPRPN